MLANLVPSLIRTYVPVAVGALLTWLAASQHVVISSHSEAALTGLAGALLSAAYYLLARLLEQRVPRLGVLLGTPVKPNYAAVASDLEAVANLGTVSFDPQTDPNTAGASMPQDAGAPPTA